MKMEKKKPGLELAEAKDLTFVGFRPGVDDYYTWIIRTELDKKQPTPFIVFGPNETIGTCWTLKDLIANFHEDTHVLQAWPGKFRTDVFHFQIKELLEYKRKGV